MKVTRVDNWPLVLNEKAEEWRSKPFAWGTADCMQFLADMVTALTGVEHREFFPRYESQQEAEAILAEHGGIAALITSRLGEPKPVAWAHRGDAVVADFGYGLTAGVCLGVNSCAPGPRGLVFRPTERAEAAWTV